MNVSARIVLTFALIAFLGGLLFIFEVQKTGKVGVVFCNVGQGDGFVIVAGSRQIVFDGGLGGKMADCLSKNMPFWDRQIEAMFLTHGQKDHMEGQIEVFKRYKVEKVIWTGAMGSGGLFDEWQRLLSDEKSQVFEVAGGDRVEAGALNFEVLWPSKNFMDLWKKVAGDDLNETSIVTRLNYGQYCAYLTGDIPAGRLTEVVDRECQILKVSHHGSKTGTDDLVVSRVRPQIAIVQVGATNSYGHPHREVIDKLSGAGVKILRNDLDGEIRLYFGRDGVYMDK